MSEPIVGNYVVQRNDSTETEDSAFDSSLNTPNDEDDIHPFDRVDISSADFNKTPRPELVHRVDIDGVGKACEAAMAKPRTLSKAVMRAKSFAQGLARSTKMNVGSLILPEPGSAILRGSASTPCVKPRSVALPDATPAGLPPSPPSFAHAEQEDPALLFPLPTSALVLQPTNSATSMLSENMTPELTTQSTMYSLPNEAIRVGESTPGTPAEQTEDSSELGSPAKEHSLAGLDVFDEAMYFGTSEMDFSLADMTSMSTLETVNKIICFLPWCIAVGGTIVLAPRHLDTVASILGYTKPGKGIHRFAHWSECAVHHVMIFLGLVASIAWWNHTAGILFVAGLLAQSFLAWSDFVVDKTIPLGEDDRQTIYLLATQYGHGGGLSDRMMRLRKTDAGFLVTDEASQLIDEEESDQE